MKKLALISVNLILVFIVSSCAALGLNEVSVSLYGYEYLDLTGRPGESITLPNEIERNGFVFDGWYIDPNLNFEASLTSFPDEDIILYPKWNKLVTITFDNSNLRPVQLVEGDTYTLPNIPDTANNYFGGWYYDATFTNEINSRLTVPNNDITIYALFYDDFDLILAYGLLNGEYEYSNDENSAYYNVFFDNSDYSVWIYETGLLKFFYFPSFLTGADVGVLVEFYYGGLDLGFDFLYSYDSSSTYGDATGSGYGYYNSFSYSVIASFTSYTGRTEQADLSLAETVIEGLFLYVDPLFENQIGVELR
jgi:hypothetical protein